MTVEANHNRCPICGYEFPNSPPHRRLLLWAGSLLLLIVFVILTLGVLR